MTTIIEEPKATYNYRDGFRFNNYVDPEIVQQELERINKRDGGLSPQTVVDEARPENSPLHPIFEWDDSIAAEAYRKKQANNLIISITVTVPHMEPVQTYIGVLQNTPKPYRSLPDILSDDQLKNQMIENAYKELLSFQRKYQQLSDIPLLKEIFDILKKLSLD